MSARPPDSLNPPALLFEGVDKAFESAAGTSFTAVKGIDLSIQAGTFNCIIGPSGCGKSTLLNMAAGLMEPSEGTVQYFGAPINGPNKRVGYLAQQSLLLPWRSVEKNVGLALEIQGVEPARRGQMVAQMLERVGLKGKERSYPAQLSGGMQRRVSIARTLIYHPETLLMDEPFGALDAQLRLSMQRQLLDLWERDKKTVLFVTHDLEEAMLLADRIIVFGTNPGRIVHVEPITFARPRDPVALRNTEEYASTWTKLWKLLEPQIEGTQT